MKSFLTFIKKWSDVLVFIPVSLILFLLNGTWIRAIDPTASIVNVEFLSILNFNILVFGAVMSCAYFIYHLFFNDYFVKGWENNVGNRQASIIHVVLWVATLITSYFILTHNL